MSIVNNFGFWIRKENYMIQVKSFAFTK